MPLAIILRYKFTDLVIICCLKKSGLRIEGGRGTPGNVICVPL